MAKTGWLRFRAFGEYVAEWDGPCNCGGDAIGGHRDGCGYEPMLQVRHAPDADALAALLNRLSAAGGVIAGTHHCYHSFGGHPEQTDPECCMCLDAACTRVDVAKAMEHGRVEVAQARAEHDAAVAYVLEHGKVEEAPF